MKKYGVGVVGCGNISRTYLSNLTKKFSVVDVVGISDILPERSAAKSDEFGLHIMTTKEICACDDIEIVVNLTRPTEHYAVSKQALESGKHVWSEKMAAVTLEEADELAALAQSKGLIYAVAPDTFLGGGLQTCRNLVDAGMIGQPVTAHALVARGLFLVSPDPDNKRMTLSPGGGIPFDMGGYYLTALTTILGPVRRAAGAARVGPRSYQNVQHPNFGELAQLKTPTCMVGVLEFESGVLGTVTTSADSFMETCQLEIFGTEGTLLLPDPNRFGGPVRLIRRNYSSLTPYEIPLTHGYSDGCSRGIGVADMAWALQNGRLHRAVMGNHVFEIVHGIWRSGDSGQFTNLRPGGQRPAPLPSGHIEASVMEAALAL
ncbi:MAG: Gfo/Idh/MocA family oxidoreductase [Oscillospiraceae bacterium]|jgi:predicted dehydrogenase|nr:Gfo/Idh/MocA family oxidoreductase [Oscillospiraceae bacterium]